MILCKRFWLKQRHRLWEFEFMTTKLLAIILICFLVSGCAENSNTKGSVFKSNEVQGDVFTAGAIGQH